MPPKKGQSKAKALPIPQGSSHIVFEDDKKKGKKHGGNPKDSAAAEASGPPKPSVKQIIGGASWTGKLPVNLLSEHCQRQKWNKPDYSMRQVPNPVANDEKLYRSEVTLSKTDPKTRDLKALPTFRTPVQLIKASEEPSALEARHFAATYALFRVSSMKNLSMALPPKYRDLWKELQALKKQDEKDGKGWQYDADPFAAELKRQEIHAAIDKRRVDQEKKEEALAKNPSLALHKMPRSKQWENAPKIEMGARIRAHIESIIRVSSVWNPYGIELSQAECRQIETRLAAIGFRPAHIREATQYCATEDEVLEWLMVHVPEDDLPGFALPTNYAAGVSLASGDLSFEAKVQRLAAAGYSRDLVGQVLKACSDVEHEAAFRLQNSLLSSSDGDINDDMESRVEWEGERTALEAILADRFDSTGSSECSVLLTTASSISATVRFIIPKLGYPYNLPAILITSKAMPAYVRLSATKQALQFAETNFKGSPMVYDLCDWLEFNLDSILADPMPLRDLSGSETATKQYPSDMKVAALNKLVANRGRPRVDGAGNAMALKTAWEERQASQQQRSMMKAREKLPAWTKQESILSSIAARQFTVITGETGSGKSTQVVQFVLDAAIQNMTGDSVNILCTQPRRVAALSLADRVAAERCSSVGNEVGYVIRGDAKVSKQTKISFMTTGVLLRKLQSSPSMLEALEGISHVFVDEVHERSLDTDFLLALLKTAAKMGSKTKVILMSATVDKMVFIDYFGGDKLINHVHVEGRTFSVSDIYLEEVLERTDFGGHSGNTESASLNRLIQGLGSKIDYDLIVSLVKHIDGQLGDDPGSILIFLPGTYEIERTLRAISSLSHVIGLPLHASLLPAEQRKVFPTAPRGMRKVIAATNVAETSITIEDVVAVIDTGKVKETRFDVSDNLVRLEEVWASQAACKQRRGRAGRVQEGTCYKLFTRTVEEKMAQKPLPEILRVPLEQLCLSVKATNAAGGVKDFLAALITPPDANAVVNALDNLHLMGALEADRITALGTYMAMLPTDLRCAKLLIYGLLFDALEPCLSIASLLSVKTPFLSPRDKREEADAAKATFPHANGDVLLNLAAFDEYREQAKIQKHKGLQAWCNEKFLSLSTLRDISSTRSQLWDALKDADLVTAERRDDAVPFTGSQQLLTAIISAALQPQIAEIRLPERKYIQSLTGARELDPEAKAIKYFIPTNRADEMDGTPTSSRSTTPQPFGNVSSDNPSSWQRVFIHPSSPLFHNTPSALTSGSSAATYLSFFSKMASGSGPTGLKIYIHSLTPLNTYTQLLFGSGGIKVDTTIPGGGLLVGDTFKVRGWARIGVLVGMLRRLLDEELRKAIDQPAASRDFSKSDVVKVVKWLIELNGQDR